MNPDPVEWAEKWEKDGFIRSPFGCSNVGPDHDHYLREDLYSSLGARFLGEHQRKVEIYRQIRPEAFVGVTFRVDDEPVGEVRRSEWRTRVRTA